MNLWAHIRAWFNGIFRRSEITSELDEELRAHVQNRADDLVRSGLPRAEAARRARIEFGGHEKFKEECREAFGTRLLEVFLQDLRFSVRLLRKSPGFAAVAIAPRRSCRATSWCLAVGKQAIG